jgi:MFS transporter, ACS family, glucarate transporter
MLPAAWAMCLNLGGSCGGTATAVMNTAGNLGGVLCTVLFGYALRATGNYNLPIFGIAAMVLVSALLFAQVDCTRGLRRGAPATVTGKAPQLFPGAQY